MRPWDYHKDLTKDRLVAVAQLIMRGRNIALDRYDTSIGDDTWTLGVCAFNYGRHHVLTAAGTDGFEWLTIADDSRRFIFRVGNVLLRFYRGDADEPSERMLRQTYLELDQLPLPLGDESPLKDKVFRIAVEVDEVGAIDRISFVAIQGEQVVDTWPIPVEIVAPTIVSLGVGIAEGRPLGSPIVEIAGQEVGENDEPA